MSSPSQLDGLAIRWCHNVTERNLSLPQTLLQILEMTQLALSKITGEPLCLLRLQIRNEALSTAVKVSIGHQGEPQGPVR